MAFSFAFESPVIGLWALRDNIALDALNALANQSARYVDHKHKPYNMELPACQQLSCLRW